MTGHCWGSRMSTTTTRFNTTLLNTSQYNTTLTKTTRDHTLQDDYAVHYSDFLLLTFICLCLVFTLIVGISGVRKMRTNKDMSRPLKRLFYAAVVFATTFFVFSVIFITMVVWPFGAGDAYDLVARVSLLIAYCDYMCLLVCLW